MSRFVAWFALTLFPAATFGQSLIVTFPGAECFAWTGDFYCAVVEGPSGTEWHHEIRPFDSTPTVFQYQNVIAFTTNFGGFDRILGHTIEYGRGPGHYGPPFGPTSFETYEPAEFDLRWLPAPYVSAVVIDADVNFTGLDRSGLHGYTRYTLDVQYIPDGILTDCGDETCNGGELIIDVDRAWIINGYPYVAPVPEPAAIHAIWIAGALLMVGRKWVRTGNSEAIRVGPGSGRTRFL